MTTSKTLFRSGTITTRARIGYLALFIILYAAWYFLFTAIADYAWTRSQHTLSTRLDELIPFVPEFEFVYILCYVIPLIPVILIRDTAVMNRLIVVFILINAVAFVTFLVFPVYCPRPEINVNSFATRLISLEYSLDKPVNNFPSLHAAIAWLAFLGCRGRNRVLSLFLFLAAVGICVGSLFVKQHYIADIAAGSVLTFAVYYIIVRIDSYLRRR